MNESVGEGERGGGGMNLSCKDIVVVGDGNVLLVKQSGLGVISGDKGGGGMKRSLAGAGEGGSKYCICDSGIFSGLSGRSCVANRSGQGIAGKRS